MIVNMETLRKLAGDRGTAMMMLGKAAEHIVCAHLIMSGYTAFLSEQALPYDALVDVGDKILRLQVKGSAFPINVNPHGIIPNYRYLFDLRKSGKERRRSRDKPEYDIAAMVALDTCEIAYLPAGAVGHKRTFSVTNRGADTVLSRGRRFEDYSFAKALADIARGSIQPFESRRGRLIEFEGESHTIAEWSRVTGIPHDCLAKRFAEGWSPERVLSTPWHIKMIREMERQVSPEEKTRQGERHRQWWAEKRAKLIPEVRIPDGSPALDQRRQGCSGSSSSTVSLPRAGQ